MATKPKSEDKSPPTDTRGKIVDALDGALGGAGVLRTSLSAISRRPLACPWRISVTPFPQRGRCWLACRAASTTRFCPQDNGELADETPRERLFDVLMRRLEVMAPYREGLREVTAWLRREPAAALAMNRVVMSSMRFMLESAGSKRRARPARSNSRASPSPGAGSSRLGSTMTNRLCPRRWLNWTAC